MNPLVSIIIPTYNRAHLICETLDSILAQTYSNWECIVIDDGSTDNTAGVMRDYVKKDNRFQYHQRPDNRKKGPNSCRNYGFELCKGEYVNWFDSDDIMLNNCLNDKAFFFQFSYDIIISTGYYADEFLVNLIKIDLKETNNLYKDFALWKIHLLLPSLAFKKSFLMQNKLFNLDLHQAQESEFFCRLFCNNPLVNFKIINSCHFLYRMHEDSISNKDIEYLDQNQESVAFFYLSNLKNGFKLKDKEIVTYFYKKLIAQWFRSLKNNHYTNNIYVLEELIKILKRNNKLNFLKIVLVFRLCMLFKLQSDKLKSWLKNINLQVD
jgi:glycosyltransferase involved in cell wall biosynthesis